jgi:organic radical activating enzyme
MSEFPIKTGTACNLKWSWSTIYLSQEKTSSCHRVNWENFKPETFKQFHNLPQKIADRTAMLRGERPGNGCEYCFKIEDAGGYSDRNHHLNFSELVPKELKENKNAVVVTPTVLEVYFNNTCNLSCLYCGPWYSSVWEAEQKKYGSIHHGIEEFDRSLKNQFTSRYDQLIAQLWEWMAENSKHLKKFHILGGEPFYQKDFIDCLDHFENYPNPHCEFVIITNLMVDDKRMDYYIERLKHLVSKRKLKGLQITCSLDCWGPQAEYIRSGLDLAQWQRNFEKLLEIKWIRLQINHAVNVLSMKYMNDLIEKINTWNSKRKIYTQYMTVVNPEYMNPDIFGGDLFHEDLKKIIDKLPNNEDFDGNIRQYFIGISKQIGYSTPNLRQIQNLKIFLEEIDRRRNTDYKVNFPWLVEEFEKYLK